jgi:plasmid stability protein
MSDLLIRNIPDALKAGLADRASKSGRSLSEEAKTLLRESLLRDPKSEPTDSPSAWDVLRPILRVDDPEEAEQYAQIMEEIEADRKRDFGRPAPDLG